MADKPYDDPEKLAEALYHGGEEHSRKEAAEYLGCSAGTISLRLNNKEHYGVEAVDDYGPDDFTEEPAEFEADELTEMVYERITEFADAEIIDDGVVASTSLDMVVICNEKSLSTEYNYSNTYVVVPESHPMGNLPDDVHRVVVDDGFEVESSRLRMPNVHFVFDGEKPGIDYRNRAWLRYEVDRGTTESELLQKCSITPRTREQFTP